MADTLRVLYVDDEPDLLELGKLFLENTGLGLALSREILSITGITITETGEPGKGARFEMKVPKGAWRIERGVHNCSNNGKRVENIRIF